MDGRASPALRGWKTLRVGRHRPIAGHSLTYDSDLRFPRLRFGMVSSERPYLKAGQALPYGVWLVNFRRIRRYADS